MVFPVTRGESPNDTIQSRVLQLSTELFGRKGDMQREPLLPRKDSVGINSTLSSYRNALDALESSFERMGT